MAEQVHLLLETLPALYEIRINMEAAFRATKANIGKEIERLKTHITPPPGRR